MKSLQSHAARTVALNVEVAAQDQLAEAADEVQRLVDPDSGFAYYMNMRTGESRYELPSRMCFKRLHAG